MLLYKSLRGHQVEGLPRAAHIWDFGVFGLMFREFYESESHGFDLLFDSSPSQKTVCIIEFNEHEMSRYRLIIFSVQKLSKKNLRFESETRCVRYNNQ